MNEISSLKNHFLIALPILSDPNFVQSVTYICEHRPEGSVGIIINRLAGISFKQLLEQLNLDHLYQSEMENIPIHIGGPVQIERGFILHSSDKTWESTLKISDSIAITTSLDIIESIAKGEGPKRFLIALGYAGWAPGQLEQELQQDAWLFGPADESIIFDQPIEKKWQQAAHSAGIDFNYLSNTSGHA